jgi:hypothetical protein
MPAEGWAAIIAAVIVSGPEWITTIRDWYRDHDD